jgi:hypothetical protein
MGVSEEYREWNINLVADEERDTHIRLLYYLTTLAQLRRLQSVEWEGDYESWIGKAAILIVLKVISFQWVPGALSLGVKRPGREADHSPPSSADVKEWVELYLHSSKTPSWRGAQLKHRDHFTFTFYIRTSVEAPRKTMRNSQSWEPAFWLNMKQDCQSLNSPIPSKYANRKCYILPHVATSLVTFINTCLTSQTTNVRENILREFLRPCFWVVMWRYGRAYATQHYMHVLRIVIRRHDTT